MKNKLLELLTKDERDLVKIKSFKNKEIAFYEDQECNEFSILLSGEIRIISYNDSGRSLTYRVITPGEVFGNNLLFSSDNKYKGNVISCSDSSLAIISKKSLLKILKNNDDFFIEYLRIQSDFGKELNKRIQILSSSDAKEKIINYISLNGGKVMIKSITLLADELAMTRENLSKCLSYLIKNKIIIRENKFYKMNN